MTGQMSEGVVVTPVISSTLLSVPAANYTYLTVNLEGNVRTIGVIQVEGGSQIGFYIMNEGNFTQWRYGTPSTVALAKLEVSGYNFTFTPDYSGLYYFIFNNEGAEHTNVLFTLNSVTYTTTPSLIIQHADFGLVIIGLLLTVIGIKTGSKRKSWKEQEVPASAERKSMVKCKFCGEELAVGEHFCPKCERSQA